MNKAFFLSVAAILTVQLPTYAAPKEFDGLTPAEVFERLEKAIAAEPAARLRRFVGLRIEFEGEDGLGTTPVHVGIRGSGTVCQVYLMPAEIKEFPPNRQNNVLSAFTPSGPIHPGIRVVGTVRSVNKQRKVVEVQSISTKRTVLDSP
jgi:hypothetical protein